MKTIILFILFVNLLTIMSLFLSKKLSLNKNNVITTVSSLFTFLIKHIGRIIPVCVSDFYSKIKEEISIVFTPRMRNDIQISLIFFALYRLLTLIFEFNSFITLVYLFPFIFNITYYFNVYLHFAYIQKRLQKLVKSNIGIDMLLSNVIHIQLHIEKEPIIARLMHMGCALILFFNNAPIVWLSLYLLISKKLFSLPNLDSNTTINDFSNYTAQLQENSINTDFRLACIIKDYILIKNCVVDTIKKEKECKKEHKLIKKLIKQLLKKYDYDESIIGTKNEILNTMLAGGLTIALLKPKIDSSVINPIDVLKPMVMTAHSKCNVKTQIGLEEKADIGDNLNSHVTLRNVEVLENGDGIITVTGATSYHKGVKYNPKFQYYSLQQTYSKTINGKSYAIEQGISLPCTKSRVNRENLIIYESKVNQLLDSIGKSNLDKMHVNIPEIYTRKFVRDKDLINIMSKERLALYLEMRDAAKNFVGSPALQVVINIDFVPAKTIVATLKNIVIMQDAVKKYFFMPKNTHDPKLIEYAAIYHQRLKLAFIEIADIDNTQFTPGNFVLTPETAVRCLKQVCLTNSTPESHQIIMDIFSD